MVAAKADTWLMRSQSLQRGDSVPIGSDAGLLVGLQYPHERCGDERKSQIHAIQVATAAKELCLWKQMLCVPHYLDSELEEIALTVKLICFTGLRVCLNL